MKKQVLLSVFAAALFAAPAASAFDLPNTAGGTQADTNAPHRRVHHIFHQLVVSCFPRCRYLSHVPIH